MGEEFSVIHNGTIPHGLCAFLQTKEDRQDNKHIEKQCLAGFPPGGLWDLSCTMRAGRGGVFGRFSTERTASFGHS